MRICNLHYQERITSTEGLGEEEVPSHCWYLACKWIVLPPGIFSIVRIWEIRFTEKREDMSLDGAEISERKSLVPRGSSFLLQQAHTYPEIFPSRRNLISLWCPKCSLQPSSPASCRRFVSGLRPPSPHCVTSTVIYGCVSGTRLFGVK